MIGRLSPYAAICVKPCHTTARSRLMNSEADVTARVWRIMYPVTQASDPLTQRDRLLAATYECVARFGLGKTTIEDVAKESGISRATIYRQFPGGRDELLLETVGWELANYFNRLADQVRDAPTLAVLLQQGLMYARRSIAEHAVLRKMMDTEPERLLPLLTTE